MKKLVIFITAIALLCPDSAIAGDNPVSHRINIEMSGVSQSSVTGDLPCPPNTVHSETYNPKARMKGINRSDLGYVGGKTRCYQMFSDNSYVVRGIQVFGLFANEQFRAETERLHADEDGNMTVPVRLEVAFWKIGPTGYPDEKVYSEEVDIIGQKTAATWGTKGAADEGFIYAFKIDLKEKVRMESGFVSVCAVDMGNNPKSSFALIHDSEVQNPGLISFDKEGQQTRWYNGGFNYCFLGNQNEPLAQKGLKFSRMLGPSPTERGKFAKVQVELRNYGTSNISDAMLELYENDRLLYTEHVDATIFSGDTYKYTFKNRVNCSTNGVHNFMLKNITPGDEQMAQQTISFFTNNFAGVCDSHSNFEGSSKYIKKVKVGTIDNESGWSKYSDFTGMKTEIKPGETLTMTVERVTRKGDFMKLWVDWNNNGLFDDEGEFIGYVSKNTIDIKIPENICTEPGDKCMRIILSNQDVSSFGAYTYGETEDYTLTVARLSKSPVMVVGSKEFSLSMNVNESTEQTLTIRNDGEEELCGKITLDFHLPLSPDIKPVYKAPAIVNLSSAKPRIQVSENLFKTPESPQSNDFTLTYAGTYNSNVGSDNVYVSFAQSFPGRMLAGIDGMMLSSIDVYIASPARKSFVVVWKGQTQNISGEELLRQQFTPKANSWNHIVLDNPVHISGEDMWIGVAFEGCKGINYLIGIDRGPATIGFGDKISVEKSPYWWSLADLGTNGNLLIRGNITGRRTSALSWLSVDDDEFVIAPRQSKNIKLHLATNGLQNNFYEARLKVTSNDPLVSLLKIPVFLNSIDPTGISLLEGISEPIFRITSSERLETLTDKAVSYIALFSMSGAMLDIKYGARSINIGHLKKGLYVVKAVYEDNTSSSGKIIIK